jgi:hypothetical protein
LILHLIQFGYLFMISPRGISGPTGGIIMNNSTDVLPALSDVYAILSATRRCYTIQLLAECEERPVHASTLANQITAIEEDIPPTHASGEPYRNVYNALYQTHLPKLADIGAIRYDSERKTLMPGPRFPMVRLLLGVNHTAYLVLHHDSISSIHGLPSIGD